MYKLLDGTSLLHMARLLCPRTQSSSGYLPQICRREGPIIYELKKGGVMKSCQSLKSSRQQDLKYIYIYMKIFYMCVMHTINIYV